jgi:soluble lytic murein transglycosylase
MIARCFWLVLALALSSTAVGQDAARRSRLAAAFAAADAGRLDLAGTRAFAGDPLLPWLQASVLARDLRSAEPAAVARVLDDAGDQPAGRWLRTQWLRELARREDWPAFRKAWQGSEDPALQCADLRARADRPDAGWVADARRVWLSAESLPSACDPVFEQLRAASGLDDLLRWQRIDLAIEAGNAGVLRHVAGQLVSGGDLALRYADMLSTPSAPSADWPGDARSQRVLAAGLAAMAKRDPDLAQAVLDRVPPAQLGAAHRAQVAYQIALWTVASYLPGAAARLAAVPDEAYDDRLREWQAREALSRADHAAALAAIQKMAPALRADSRWTYFEARLRERLGQADASRALYLRAATSPNFHGWLAADRLQQSYVLCPLEPSAEPALRDRVAGDAGLGRAMDLYAIGRVSPATQEWAAAVKAMDDDARRLAVQRALGEGWFDRAVFGMNGGGDDSRYYSLRFPLHHAEDIRQRARENGLDPAWIAAEMRAESVFDPRARSSADARGLMQIQPATGAGVAARLGVPWRGGDSLYDPATSVQLGAAYLRQLLDRYDGLPYLAIAAYNAGPAPVNRWRAARGALEPDYFIESIPWKETRDYVARVLAFSVVYDWRLDAVARPVGERMIGRFDARPDARRSFTCPNPGPATP